MVELARRGSADPQHIRALRGMDWRKQQRSIPEIAAVHCPRIADSRRGCPSTRTKSPRPQFTLLGQFLATAVNSMARSADVAPGLIGSVQDVRDLIAHHMGYESTEVPALAQGWRAEVVGQVVDRLLDGQLAIRITDPNSNQPLSFEPVERDRQHRPTHRVREPPRSSPHAATDGTRAMGYAKRLTTFGERGP